MLVALSFISYLTMRLENTTFVFILAKKVGFLTAPQPLSSPESVHRLRTSRGEGEAGSS